jgi:hypothetical protein
VPVVMRDVRVQLQMHCARVSGWVGEGGVGISSDASVPCEAFQRVATKKKKKKNKQYIFECKNSTVKCCSVDFDRG